MMVVLAAVIGLVVGFMLAWMFASARRKPVVAKSYDMGTQEARRTDQVQLEAERNRAAVKLEEERQRAYNEGREMGYALRSCKPRFARSWWRIAAKLPCGSSAPPVGGKILLTMLVNFTQYRVRDAQLHAPLHQPRHRRRRRLACRRRRRNLARQANCFS
jgi:hypothetical protein